MPITQPQALLPPPNQAWIDPRTGMPTQAFYQFMSYVFPNRVDVLGRILRTKPFLFRNLPRPVEGMIAGISDSTTATPGQVIAGLGQFHVCGYYTGKNWIVL